jgi:hypothetical protein
VINHKNQMKKPLLIAICILTLFVSCKKSSSEAPTDTISANIDGVSESFNTAAYAHLSTGVQLNSNLVITGGYDGAGGSDIMSFTITSDHTITKGTYVNTSSSNGSYVSIAYTKGPLSLANPTIYASVVDGTPPSSITITSISSTNIQGTFSGQLVLSGGSAAKSVTGGKFNVQIK